MYEVVVIGVSAGGLKALTALISALPESFGMALVIVQHIREDSDDFLARHLDKASSIRVKEADEKEAILTGTVYIAPPGYHLLIEDDRSFGLSVEPLVNFSRPSIDVLFESAADVYSDRLVGIILTGASTDGTNGLSAVKRANGLTIVQNPETAEFAPMPLSAINTLKVDHVLALGEIAPLLCDLDANSHTDTSPSGMKK